MPCIRVSYVVKILSDLAVITIFKLNAINIVNGSLVHNFFRVESTEMWKANRGWSYLIESEFCTIEKKLK